MTSQDWRSTALAMKSADPNLTYAEIARVVGTTRSAVWKLLNPERFRDSDRRTREKRRVRRQEIDREYSRRKRDICECCGRTRGTGSGRRSAGRSSGYCRACVDAIADVRRSIIEGIWADGWSVADLSNALGWSPTSHPPVSQWREAGWDLPYRYRNTKRQLSR